VKDDMNQKGGRDGMNQKSGRGRKE